MTRAETNKRIGYLVHAKLRLAEEDYRQIVYNIDQKSGGFVRNCDDESANLVLLSLERLVEKKSSVREQKKNDQQHRFIARLMDYLHWHWSDTASFLAKITGKHHTSQCTSGELSKVIRGMISIIDKDIDAGKIIFTPEKLKEYRYKTHFHRINSQS
jgi:hypothetical protein